MNLIGRVEFLSPEEVQSIHETSMRLLEEVGVEVPVERAREIFAGHGAHVSGTRVRLPRQLVEETVKKAPSSFPIHARNPEKSVVVGDGSPVFAPGYGAPFLMDYEAGPRHATMEDYEKLVRLVDALPEMDLSGFLLVEPHDVPADKAYLHMLRAHLCYSDKPFVACTEGAPGAKTTLDMAGIVFGGREKLRNYPVTVGLINTLSPLGFSSEMLEALMTLAEWGQPAVVASMAQAGATAPVTLAGMIAQVNAEVLSGIVLAQLINPGTPVIYGSTSTIMDMATAAAAIGSPEYSVLIASQAQLGRLYHLPVRSGGSLTDSQVPDVQAGLESMMSLLTVVNSGVDFVLHAGGILGSYLTLSFEKLVIDHEICGMVRRYARGLSVAEDDLAFDVIAKVGPGGNFLMEDHTLRYFRHAFYMPALISRDALPTWQEKGEHDMAARAHQYWQKVVARHEPAELAPALVRELDAYLASHSG